MLLNWNNKVETSLGWVAVIEIVCSIPNEDKVMYIRFPLMLCALKVKKEKKKDLFCIPWAQLDCSLSKPYLDQ